MRSLLRTSSLALTLALVTVACGDKQPAATKPRPCQPERACPQGRLCLAQECVDPSIRGYAHPETAVTPQRIEKEIQDRTQVHTDRVEKAMGAE